MSIVETTGLSKRYRGTWALRDCCLAISEDRVAALVGPNGSGKTTLLNITVGLIAPTRACSCSMNRCPPWTRCPGTRSCPR